MEVSVIVQIVFSVFLLIGVQKVNKITFISAIPAMLITELK